MKGNEADLLTALRGARDEIASLDSELAAASKVRHYF